MLSQILRQAALAVRRMRRQPWTSLLVVMTLSLGIGANAVVFGLADAVFVRKLPYPAPDQLVAVDESQRGSTQTVPVADGNFPDLRAQASSMSGLAAYLCDRMLVGVGSAVHRIPTCGITADFFPVLGITPLLGRVSSSDLASDGPASEAVISYGFWQSVLGGDPGVLGRTVVVLGEVVPVVGVMPKGFAFPAQTDLWVRYEAALGTSRTAHNLQVVGRLAPNFSLASARSQMSAVARRLAEAHGAEIGDSFDLVVNDLHADITGGHATTLLLLACSVGLVLLVACGNVAAILLARSLGSLGNTAIRQAVGASRFHLALELLVEGTVFGAASALVSLLLSAMALPLLVPFVPPEILLAGPPAMNLRLAAFALLLGTAMGVVCGVPALWLTQWKPLQTFRGAPVLGIASSGRRGWLAWFVVLQYALSLVALGTAGLFVKSLRELLHTDPGFRTDGFVLAEVEVPTDPPSAYADPAKLLAYFETLQRNVAGIPGVQHATLARPLPFTPPQYNGLALREGDSGDGDDQEYPDYRVIGPAHFEALRIPLLLGREFTEHDTPTSEPVVIVNQGLARRLWGTSNPLDQRLSVPGLDPSKRLLRVVGVVGDARYRALELTPRTAVYVPWTQHLNRAGNLGMIVTTSSTGDAAALVRQVRERIVVVDPGLPAGRVRTIDTVVRASTVDHRLRSQLLGAFAGLAVVLAVVGVYGALSYSLSKRQRELGLRVALGARPGDIHGMVVRDGVYLVIVGQVLGALAWPVNVKLLEGALFGVRATDPVVLLMVSVSLAAVVLGTCYSASRRVFLSDPSALLKDA